ncbi:PepSY domain-containing protein [Thiomicrorhabdus heinhorstiae]|uniref:PepSY domain-containing protein n=1 Tax=Thiomicrorhabdus heinhorstiae TaxID=2748010 RepID=A0ABS0BW70_9GAMM|nr:PepSY domain-containing protein [Thiomicrorhabdus heinhorstiae]MBF6058063.1 PepSY domain-containing protein [Thiomicrorhabdus heinhorstiae]
MIKRSLLVLTALTVSANAYASAKCPKAPKDQWMHVLDMQKKIVNDYGFAIKKFQTDGNCYEIYGWGLNDKKDKFVKVEVYFNPVNGEIVKKVIDD